MKNKWVYIFSGFVRIEVIGKYGERFLNRCIEEKITIWDISRVEEEKIVANILLTDVKRLKPLLRMTSCKVVFLKRYGLPFFYRRLLKRSGLAIGFLAAFVIILLLSNMVWSVTIKGASPKAEHELRQIIADIGIGRGQFIFLLPSVEDIQKEVTERLDGATWIGVRLNGTNYEFEVVEQTLPEQAEAISPRHLVATKKAVIHDLFVEKGSAQVKPNQLVQKGDLLVSGYIGKEGSQIAVGAKGVVFGEIWYKSTVNVPLKQSIDTLTGEHTSRYFISILGFDIPVWGFKNESFAKKELNEKIVPLAFLNLTLPIHFKQKQWFEKEQFMREYSKEEAIQAGIKAAAYELKQRLPKDAQIKSEKVLHETVENGKVKLLIHYQVIEDITGIERISQGE